jgi:hypothetical protein
MKRTAELTRTPMKRTQHGAYLRMAPTKAVARVEVDKPLCDICLKPFVPWSTTQKVCSLPCAKKVPVVARKKERAKTKERKEAAKPRSQWLKEAQQAFNAWVRMRDAHLPCVSCGRHHEGQWHAGHYLSTRARPELRFEPDNVQKQCQPCNVHLSGNLVLYRAELIRRIGLERVDWLEGPHEPAKWTIDELRAIRDENRAKTRDLKQ